MTPPRSRLVAAPLGGALRTGAVLLLDLVFPRRCGLCGAFGAFLCEECTAALPAIERRRCPACLRALPPDECPSCRSAPAQLLDSVTAAVRFQDGARRLVHRLKYERLSALAEPMGALMADLTPRTPSLPAGASTAESPAPLPGLAAGQEVRAAPDLIVPVPLHPRRERARGFNQSALLARAIGRRWEIEVAARALVRMRPTTPQARTTSTAERAANVAGAFAPRAPLTGRAILLVDDVATTGATLRACALALRQAGAADVHALVFAHEE